MDSRAETLHAASGAPGSPIVLPSEPVDNKGLCIPLKEGEEAPVFGKVGRPAKWDVCWLSRALRIAADPPPVPWSLHGVHNLEFRIYEPCGPWIAI
jgi:hypothetical protein